MSAFVMVELATGRYLERSGNFGDDVSRAERFLSIEELARVHRASAQLRGRDVAAVSLVGVAASRCRGCD